MGYIAAKRDIRKTRYIPWRRPVLDGSLGRASGFALGTSEAFLKHWPSPRNTYIKGCISLLAGLYLIYTRFRLF